VEYHVIWESWNFQASPMGFCEFNNQWGLLLETHKKTTSGISL
jgi:hypothetical protein